MTKKLKTFTLVEMLIVIVIIGILAAAMVPRVYALQGRARDTQRKNDFRIIHSANEIYLLDNNQYAKPHSSASTGCNINANCWVMDWTATPWISTLTGILDNPPKDPLSKPSAGGWPNNGTGNTHYVYGNVYNMLSGKNTYDLWAQFENPNDTESCASRGYKSGYFNLSSCPGNPGDGQLYDVSPGQYFSFGNGL